ncbi:hypothetical protein RI129_009338 [Pyrocoelia pectoralis]|uniref:Uncharacterized protein n=1 Tax=Pyrocoelia pectoralis TaxID=417401 RepID=A0AAN7ZHS9_9COLE
MDLRALEDRPKLLIPWLVMDFTKNVMPSVISLVVGTYTCFATGFQKPAFWDFILAQLINHAPRIYVFLCVRSFYKDLQSTTQNAIEPKQPQQGKEMVVRRRKASLMRGYPTVFYLKCVSTFEELMQYVTDPRVPKKSKSLHSLLQSRVSRAEENDWKKMFGPSPISFSKKPIRETVMRNFKITNEYIHLPKLSQNEEYRRILSKDVVSSPSPGHNPIRNDNFDTGSTVTLESTSSTDAETQICPVLNYIATSLVDNTIETNTSLDDVSKSTTWRTGRSLTPLPVPKLQTSSVFYWEILDSARTSRSIKDVQRTDFSCQVSILSIEILNSPLDSPPNEILIFIPEST